MITRRSTLITLAAVLVLLLTTGALWRISKARCFQLVGEVTCHVETSEKLVALSFDDGPTPEGVDAVLNQLEPRGIKATFFLIGDRMEKFPVRQSGWPLRGWNWAITAIPTPECWADRRVSMRPKSRAPMPC